IAALPADPAAPAARWVAVILAAAALAAAGCLISSPISSRHEVTLVQGGRLRDGTPRRGRADNWCWGVLGLAVAALITTAVVSGWTDRRHGWQTGALPGLTIFFGVLLAVEVDLLL